MKYRYNKSDALVTIDGQADCLDIKIEKDNKNLEMHISRTQREEHERYIRSQDMGAAPAIKGDIFAQYSIDINIDETRKNFNHEFSAEPFNEWGNKIPEYHVNLENGIPANEYKQLTDELSKQNVGVAQLFKNYILNADDLQKCNNLQQSIFNQKLDEFLR